MVMGELELKTQLLVIGSGPGGYAAAFRAADLGLDVAMVDTAARPGGVCLFTGCIPSKTLLFISELIRDARRAEHMGVAFGPPRIDIGALRKWQSRVASLTPSADGVSAILEGAAKGGEQYFDRALVAIGRRPATEDLGLETTRVELDAQGFIQVDDRQRTADPSILAVGDVTGGLMLAHKAGREGKVAAEVICGRPSAFDARAIPAIVYTDPQIAWCGLSEETARRENRPVKIQRFPWKYSGRAATMGLPEGLTKIIVDAPSGRIIGAGMVGRDTEGLIAEAVLAIEMGALAEDLALTIHPHPTLSETEAEAAELYLGGATHVLS